MKLYIAALAAAIASAQETAATTTETTAEPAAAKTPDDVVTDFVWATTKEMENKNGNWWQFFTATTKPVAPGQVVSGTATCSTDADGANSLSVALQGTWNLQWRQTSGSRNNDVFYGGLMFALYEDSTGTTETNGETWAIGGTRNKDDRENKPAVGDGITTTFYQRRMKPSESPESQTWDYEADNYFGTAGLDSKAWTLGSSSTIEATEPNRKYLQGLSATASRPFVYADGLTLKNQSTYKVFAGAWVYDNKEKKNVTYAYGFQDWKIDMPVPKPETPKTFCADGVTEKVEGVTCPGNAVALSFSALAAAAMLIMSF